MLPFLAVLKVLPPFRKSNGGKFMGFNYGFEKRKFDRVWEKLHREYIEAGMDETAILSMYEFDCRLAAGLPQ